MSLPSPGCWQPLQCCLPCSQSGQHHWSPACLEPPVCRSRTDSPPRAQEGRERARGGVAGGGGAGRHSLPEQPAKVIKKNPKLRPPPRLLPPPPPRASGWTQAKDPGARITPPREGRPCSACFYGCIPCAYSVWEARRGHQKLELQNVMRCHMGSGDQTPCPLKNNQCS